MIDPWFRVSSCSISYEIAYDKTLFDNDLLPIDGSRRRGKVTSQ